MILSRAQFLAALGAHLVDRWPATVDPPTISDATLLHDDLHLDSLGAIELLIWVEELAGAYDPTISALPGPDVGAVSALYRRLAAAPRSPAEAVWPH